MSAEKKVVIFDFDGTMADVVPLMRKIYAEVATAKGYPELTDADFERLRKGNLKDLMKWSGVRAWQLPRMLREGRRVFYAHRKEVLLFRGISDLITELHSADYDLYILSSNSVRTIKYILKQANVAEPIHVLRRPPLFGKAGSIKQLIRRKRYSRNNVWMIGDETRDIDAANKAGVRSVAVSWGLQHEVALAKSRPEYVVSKVSELRRLLLKGGN